MKLCEECCAVVGGRSSCPECGTATGLLPAFRGPRGGRETGVERIRKLMAGAPTANDAHGRVVLA